MMLQMMNLYFYVQFILLIGKKEDFFHEKSRNSENQFWTQSPKFKRVSLKETPELYFCGLNSCEDFDLRDSENREYEETK